MLNMNFVSFLLWIKTILNNLHSKQKIPLGKNSKKKKYFPQTGLPILQTVPNDLKHEKNLKKMSHFGKVSQIKLVILISSEFHSF